MCLDGLRRCVVVFRVLLVGKRVDVKLIRHKSGMRIDINLGAVAVNIALCKSVSVTAFKRVRQVGFDIGCKSGLKPFKVLRLA